MVREVKYESVRRVCLAYNTAQARSSSTTSISSEWVISHLIGSSASILGFPIEVQVNALWAPANNPHSLLDSLNRLLILYQFITEYPNERFYPADKIFVTSSMSSPPTVATLSNFRSTFNASLKAYEKRTKKDLLAHPLAVRLHSCDNPAEILTILQEQVQQFEQTRSLDERLTKWLYPTVNVLLAFSEVLGDGISLVNLNI